MRFTLKFFYKNKIKKIIINSIIALVKSVFFIFSFFFLFRFINAVFNQESIEEILLATFLTLILSVITYLLNGVYKLYYKKNLKQSVLELYAFFIDKMIKNNPKEFNKKTPQEYIYSSYEVCSLVSNYFFEPIYLFIEDIIKFLGILILLFYFNWIIALISFFSSVFLVMFFYVSFLKQIRLEAKNIGIEEENQYTIENFINSHNYFFRFNKSEKWSKFLSKKIKSSHFEMYKNTKNIYRWDIYNHVVISFFSFIPIITMGLFSYFNLFGVNLEIFIFLSFMVSVWMRTTTDIFSTIPNYDTAKNLVIDFEIKPLEAEPKHKIELFNSITIKNSKVNKTFTFDKDNKIKIAIIGKSGSGKTTFIENIMNYGTDLKYEISWNNKKIGEINQENIKENISYIDFDNFLFSGTIKDNITLFENIEDKKVFNVLEVFGLGYLKINENIKNTNLSQGEIQRLKLARALLFKKNIIILDEAFSNIEPKLASKIRSNLISEHNCYIEVSHHLSSDDLNKYDYVLRINNV